MGFPTWTLWGMGASALGAVLVLALALLALSPQAARRLGLGGLRLDLRARALTGYALALVLLAFGFFVAGVPLEGGATGTVEPLVLVVTATPESGGGIVLVTPRPGVAPTLGSTPTPGTPASGAFAGPPAATATGTGPGDATTTLPAPTAATGAAGSAAVTPTTTSSPTPTPSPTATTTPTPTLTPTPLSGETATVNASASTLWLRRTPGGNLVVQVNNGDTVLLLPRRASYAGETWQEISTLAGISGWVRDAFLVPNQ